MGAPSVPRSAGRASAAPVLDSQPPAAFHVGGSGPTVFRDVLFQYQGRPAFVSMPSGLPPPALGMAWWRPFEQPAGSTAIPDGQQQAQVRLPIPAPISGMAWFGALDLPARMLAIQHQTVPGWPIQAIVTATIQENEWLIRTRRRGRR
jgi:hypothetical protein